MKRREFLRHSVIAGAGLPMMSEWRLDRPARWFEISLAQWSLHRAIRAGQIDHLVSLGNLFLCLLVGVAASAKVEILGALGSLGLA